MRISCVVTASQSQHSACHRAKAVILLYSISQDRTQPVFEALSRPQHAATQSRCGLARLL